MKRDFEIAYDQDRFRDAIPLLKKALRKDSDDHWLLTRLASCYYEMRQFKKAFTFSERALLLCPRCPLVLWGHAGTLHMLGRIKGAISIYQYLRRLGVKRIAYGPCGEGEKWAASHLADCSFALADCHFALNRHQRAKIYLKDHVRRRAQSKSIYSMNLVKKLERCLFER